MPGLPVPPRPTRCALIPQRDIAPILDTLQSLRMADENIYLRMSSIDTFNGMVSPSFSCEGSHYMRYDQFLGKNTALWFGSAA